MSSLRRPALRRKLSKSSCAGQDNRIFQRTLGQVTLGIVILVALLLLIACGFFVRPLRNWIATRGGGLTGNKPPSRE